MTELQRPKPPRTEFFKEGDVTGRTSVAPETTGWVANDVSVLIGGLLILLSFCLLGLIVSAFFDSIKMMLVFGFSAVCIAVLAGAEIMASCVATVIENVMDTILSRISKNDQNHS